MKQIPYRFLAPVAVIAVATLISTLGVVGQGPPPPAPPWHINRPEWGERFLVDAHVPTAGDANEADHAYTVTIRDFTWELPMGGCSGTSTSTFNWSCTAAPPQNGWFEDWAYVELYVDGDLEHWIAIEFIDP